MAPPSQAVPASSRPAAGPALKAGKEENRQESLAIKGSGRLGEELRPTGVESNSPGAAKANRKLRLVVGGVVREKGWGSSSVGAMFA